MFTVFLKTWIDKELKIGETKTLSWSPLNRVFDIPIRLGVQKKRKIFGHADRNG